jgi:outer membrane protein OmpA-like peptidoglycan-associated protein/tetratricopeptide (TPR) repeat protein
MKIIIALFITLQFLSIEVSAQKKKLEKANEKYEQLAFIDATEIYLEVAKSGYKSEELYKKLGNSYYFNANYENADKWYRELFAIAPAVNEPIYYLRYSQSLKAIGKDEESEKWFDKYAEKVGLSEKKYKKAEDYLAIIEKNSNRYNIKPLSINTTGIDFGSAFLEDKIVYASTQNKTSNFKRKSPWDGLSFLDLYEARKNKYGELIGSQKLKGDVNTKLHESSAIFTKDGKTMYFTRNNTKRKSKRSKKQIQNLKIYRAHLINDKWVNVEDLSINGDDFSTAHPALSSDETLLYFASDRPESIGQTDLFKVSINVNGSLGNVINLGEAVNTKGRESFPFITKDNELYFSSDGHYGLGGYDVFYTKINEDTTFGSLLNVGKPINSSFDDIAFIIEDHKGYISSNRLGGLGYDDIYSFVEIEDIKEILVGDDIAKILNIIIHFDLDKSFIRPDAQVELEKLVVFMKKYPTFKIDIRSHTDSQASYSYNIGLSDRRAKSTLKYLVQRGIPIENLSAKGYGETQLVNNCTNGVKCTDTKHEENRRSEFIVKKIN